MVIKMSQKRFSAKKVAGLAILAALGIALAELIHFPIFPGFTFLEYDAADIPIFIAAFMYGPFSGVIVTSVVAVVQGVTVSASSGWIGIVMHFVATGAFCLVAGFIYKCRRTYPGAIVALVSGVLVMTGLMLGMNVLLTPIFFGWPREQVVAILFPVILPFNLIKAGVNSLFTFFLYKRIGKLFGAMFREKIES
jgi:Predicted membrane protein